MPGYILRRRVAVVPHNPKAGGPPLVGCPQILNMLFRFIHYPRTQGAVYTPCSLSGVSCNEIKKKQRGGRPIADMWLLSARVTASSIAHYGVSRPRQSTTPLGGTLIQYKAVRIMSSLCLAVCLLLFRYVITQKGETKLRQ
jgi:hypothetical protein